MAKRGKKSSKIRYRTKTVSRYVGKAKSMFKGGLIAGAIAGAGGGLLRKFVNLGGFTQPIADIAVGMYMRNETLETIGGRSIGAMLVSGVNMPGVSTGAGATSATGGLVG